MVRPSPMSSSFFSLISPVHAIDLSSLIIFFTLIFSSEPSLRRRLLLYKIDTIAYIPCMRTPLAVVDDFPFSLLYHFPNFDLR